MTASVAALVQPMISNTSGGLAFTSSAQEDQLVSLFFFSIDRELSSKKPRVYHYLDSMLSVVCELRCCQSLLPTRPIAPSQDLVYRGHCISIYQATVSLESEFLQAVSMRHWSHKAVTIQFHSRLFFLLLLLYASISRIMLMNLCCSSYPESGFFFLFFFSKFGLSFINI